MIATVIATPLPDELLAIRETARQRIAAIMSQQADDEREALVGAWQDLARCLRNDLGERADQPDLIPYIDGGLTDEPPPGFVDPAADTFQVCLLIPGCRPVNARYRHIGGSRWEWERAPFREDSSDPLAGNQPALWATFGVHGNACHAAALGTILLHAEIDADAEIDPDADIPF